MLETIEMRVPLRQLTTHDLPLVNPLDVEATFTLSVDNAEVACPKSVTVPARGKGVAKVEWRPLLGRAQACQLKVSFSSQQW